MGRTGVGRSTRAREILSDLRKILNLLPSVRLSARFLRPPARRESRTRPFSLAESNRQHRQFVSEVWSHDSRSG